VEKVKEKISEIKSHNDWNRESYIKERYQNFIQVIKGKVEETTPKRKNKYNLGNGGKGKIRDKEKQPECVWLNTECDKVIRIRKAKLLKLK
jgi:hypothetical protein